MVPDHPYWVNVPTTRSSAIALIAQLAYIYIRWLTRRQRDQMSTTNPRLYTILTMRTVAEAELALSVYTMQCPVQHAGLWEIAFSIGLCIIGPLHCHITALWTSAVHRETHVPTVRYSHPHWFLSTKHYTRTCHFYQQVKSVWTWISFTTNTLVFWVLYQVINHVHSIESGH